MNQAFIYNSINYKLIALFKCLSRFMVKIQAFIYNSINYKLIALSKYHTLSQFSSVMINY